MQTDHSPPPGEAGQFGYATNVAFVEPELEKRSLGKTIAVAAGTVIVCLFLLAVVAIFALTLLGSTVSTSVNEIEIESGASAPVAIALADEVFVDSTSSYEIRLGTTWEPMGSDESPAGTQGWNVIENNRAVAAVFTTAGPSVARSYDEVLAGTITGLTNALPPDAEIDGVVRVQDGKRFATITTSFRDENGIDVSTFQLIRIGDGTIAVATLSGPSTGFEALRERVGPALYSLDVLR